MTDRPDPYRSVARELLCVLAAEGRPMSLRELEQPGRLAADDAAFQLSVARVAGFVRAAPAELGARRAKPDRGPPMTAEPDPHQQIRDAVRAEAEALEATSDLHASADYRRRVAAALAERALVDARAQAKSLSRSNAPMPGGRG